MDLHLSDDELAKFHASADVMREHCKLISQYLLAGWIQSNSSAFIASADRCKHAPWDHSLMLS